jgi:hypothetical protein
MRRWLGGDKGGAATEFVVVGPLLGLILGGIIQVGSLVQATAVVRNAAREGVRYAAMGWPLACPASPVVPPCSVNPTNDVTHVVTTYLSNALGGRSYVQLASASVTVCYPAADPGCTGAGTPTVGQPAAVAVSVPVDVLGQQITLTSSATMQMLQLIS